LIVPRVVSSPAERTLPQKRVLARESKFLETIDEKARAGFEEVAVLQTKDHWNRYVKDITSGVNVADNVFLQRLNPAIDSFSFDTEAMTKKFEKPTLILTGHQDHIVGYRDAWTVIENYPRATFAVLDRAGHALQIEQEQIFNVLVNEWLDRVEESIQ
jgi:pimeloyl-ACP methyl ester carboxylesterase